ncbi:pumilio homology domain family member 4 [Ceratobasidium sp. AG-Ba]|nr:pumilio homology domain family member 4 [Ceratobasidium sp. AG-Ba]
MPPATKSGPSSKRQAGSGSQVQPSPKKAKAVAAGKVKAVPVPKKVPILESEGSDQEEWEDESEMAEGGAGSGDEDMGELSDGMTSKTPKDPQASREGHKVQKELQAQRRAAKPHSALLSEAKRVWALARKIDLPRAERQKHVAELMGVLRGNVQDIVFKHDASRIVQTLVKYGGQSERDEVAAELKGKYRDLAQNKYGKFLVTKLIRYCPTHRTAILSEFHSHVIRLLLHREASPIIADAYDLHASAAERNLLLRDFYGKEVALFDSGAIQKAGLRGALENATPERKKRVLGSVAESLMSIFNNPDKGAVSHAIVHRVLWEYLAELALIEESEKEETERLRRELFDNCQELLAEMVHTRDGSRAVREFVARGTAKDRKQIIKILKPHIEKMCADEEAQLVLFTIFDVVDDTKLVGKSLVTDITALAPTFARTLARRVLLYLLTPRSPRHFTPALLRNIAQTDFAQGTTSKKDVDIRRSELRAAASPGLVKALEDDAEGLVRDRGGSVFVGEVMLFADGDKSKALNALLAPISKPYTPLPSGSDPSDPSLDTHILNLSHASRMYKTLIQGGHFNQQTKQIERVEGAPKNVTPAFMHAAGKDNLIAMGLGDEAFLVAEIVGRLQEEGNEAGLEEVKGWFGKEIRTKLKTEGKKGSNVLLERLGA